MIRSTGVNALISDLIVRVNKDPTVVDQITQNYTWKNNNQLTVFQFNYHSPPATTITPQNSESFENRPEKNGQQPIALQYQQYRQHLRLHHPEQHEFSPADLDYVHTNQLFLPSSFGLSHQEVETILRQGAILSYYQQQITVLARNFLELLQQIDSLLGMPTLFISHSIHQQEMSPISIKPSSTRPLSSAYGEQQVQNDSTSSGTTTISTLSSIKSSKTELSIILAPLSHRHEIILTYTTCKTHIYYLFEQWGICRDKFILNTIRAPQKRNELYQLLTADYHRLDEWILKFKELTLFCHKSTISKSAIYHFLYNQFSLAIPLPSPADIFTFPPTFGSNGGGAGGAGGTGGSVAPSTLSVTNTTAPSNGNSSSSTGQKDQFTHQNGYFSFPSLPNTGSAMPVSTSLSTTTSSAHTSSSTSNGEHQHAISFFDSSSACTTVAPHLSQSTSTLSHIPSMIWCDTPYQQLYSLQRGGGFEHQTPSTHCPFNSQNAQHTMVDNTPQQKKTAGRSQDTLRSQSYLQNLSHLQSISLNPNVNAPLQHHPSYRGTAMSPTTPSRSFSGSIQLTSGPLSTLLPQIYTPPSAVSPFLDFIQNSGGLLGAGLCYNLNIRASEENKVYGLLGLELQLLFRDGKYQITIRNTGSFLIKIVEALFTILDEDDQNTDADIPSIHSLPSHPVAAGDYHKKHFDSPLSSTGGSDHSGTTTMMSDGLPSSQNGSITTNEDGTDLTPPPHSSALNSHSSAPQQNMGHSSPHLNPTRSSSSIKTPDQRTIKPTSITIRDDKHPLLRQDWLDFVNVDKALTPLPQRQRNLLASQRVQSIEEVQPSFICFSFESPTIAPYQMPENSSATHENDKTHLNSPQPTQSAAANSSGISPHPFSFHHQGFPQQLLNSNNPPNTHGTTTMNEGIDEKDDEVSRFHHSTHPKQLPQPTQKPVDHSTQQHKATTAFSSTNSVKKSSNNDLCCSFLVEIIPK